MKKIIDYIISENLEDTLINIVHDNNISYIPSIYLKNGSLYSIKFNVGKMKCTIKDKNNSLEEISSIVISNSEYDIYTDVDTKFYNGLISLENMSTYSEQYLKVVETVYRSPMKKRFNNIDTRNLNLVGLDSRKAYTSDFMDIKKYPVFNMFDLYNVYNGERIEDYSEYIILCFEETLESLLIFPDKITAIFGLVLREVKNIKYKILYVRTPSNLHESNSKELIKMVYDSNLSEDKKKQVINLNLGKLEKKNNNRTNSKVFKNIDEAYYYKKVYEKYDPKISIIEPSNYEGREICEKAVYILSFGVKKQLCEGFQSIKDLVYDIRRMKNLKTFLKLKENNIVCYGVITDSMIINNDDLEKAYTLFNFENVIGNYKVEYNKIVPRELLTRKNNNIKFDKVESNILTLQDEKNNDELKYISTFNNVFYKGLYPGVGKTTACSMFEGEKLFITPYNKLCQQLRIKYNNSKAITFNKLFGLNISDEKNYKTKDYNLEGVKCIIFDEVLLYNVRRLQKIKKFMNEHKEIRFLFSGDCDQRKPIEFGCNNVDLKTYQMNCMRVICNNEVILSVPKRLKTEEDIRKMMQLKQDIFNNKLNVIETLKKNGFKIINNIKDVKTHKNICYFNYRANNIINNILGKIAIPQEAKEINGLKYWVGLELICKKSQKITNKIKSYVNYSYEIIKIDDDKITLLNREDNEELKISNNQLYYFSHPYCMTCDSAQGLTIEEEYTIFDCNIPYTDREFVWTALTRGTDFKNITIFEHNEEEIKRLTISRLIQYFNMKVMNYKKQDAKASREITEDYINSNWIIDQFEKNKICPICFNNLFINIDDDNIIISNITVDRIDNKISHTKNNCRLMCCFCNCSKH